MSKVHVKKKTKTKENMSLLYWLIQALQAEVTVCHGIISQLVSNTCLCLVHSQLNVSVSFTNEEPMQYKNTVMLCTVIFGVNQNCTKYVLHTTWPSCYTIKDI